MEIKFKVWCKDKNEWEKEELFLSQKGYLIQFPRGIPHDNKNHIIVPYIGHQDITGKDIYVGDIHREEIEEEGGDKRYYMVCTYIQEWSLYVWLRADEYLSYQQLGADCLDEYSFWTYPILDVEAIQIKVIGNIFENPKLLIEK